MTEKPRRKTGLLTRLANAVYCHLALAICLMVLGAIPVAALSLLTSTAANLPWFVLAQLPVAPALAAGLYAVRAWRGGAEVAPFALFVKGLRLNVVDVLKWWIPALVIVGILAFNLVHAGGISGATGWQVASFLIGGILLLACGHALLISSAFSFRTVDAARLAVYLLGAGWKLTLLFISLLIVATAIVVTISEVGLLVLLWAFVSLLEFASRPTLQLIRKEFTPHAG